MGQSSWTVSNTQPSTSEKLTLNRFELWYVIGRGGFGKVWKIKDKNNSEIYALKEMKKVKVIDKRCEVSILYEREILVRINSPFIVNMHYSFQDKHNLYLVMDYLSGGDWRYHLCKIKRFNEEQTSKHTDNINIIIYLFDIILRIEFFWACTVWALEYTRQKGIIHRDIKPENLVLDSRGYWRVTDFGIAKKYQRNNKFETSGTPGYMAPEVMKGMNHSYSVDYFALGVIGFELMFGKRPYWGRTRQEIMEKMLSTQIQVLNNSIPDGWSNESASFINRLLQRKSEIRLGNSCIADIKKDKWFKDINWESWYNKELVSPFVPNSIDNFDKSYCEGQDLEGSSTKERYINYQNERKYWSVFRYYTYDKNLGGCINHPSVSSPHNNNNKNSTRIPLRPSSSKEQNKKRVQSTKMHLNNTLSPKKTSLLFNTKSFGNINNSNANQWNQNKNDNKKQLMKTLLSTSPKNNNNNNISKPLLHRCFSAGDEDTITKGMVKEDKKNNNNKNKNKFNVIIKEASPTTQRTKWKNSWIMKSKSGNTIFSPKPKSNYMRSNIRSNRTIKSPTKISSPRPLVDKDVKYNSLSPLSIAHINSNDYSSGIKGKRQGIPTNNPNVSDSWIKEEKKKIIICSTNAEESKSVQKKNVNAIANRVEREEYVNKFIDNCKSNSRGKYSSNCIGQGNLKIEEPESFYRNGVFTRINVNKFITNNEWHKDIVESKWEHLDNPITVVRVKKSIKTTSPSSDE